MSGSRKNIPNKATAQARQAIGMFVDKNAFRLEGWLDKIAKDDPEAAFRAFMSVVEYHVPKLNRTTIEGDADKPIEHNVTVTIVEGRKVD